VLLEAEMAVVAARPVLGLSALPLAVVVEGVRQLAYILVGLVALLALLGMSWRQVILELLVVWGRQVIILPLVLEALVFLEAVVERLDMEMPHHYQ
jgi:hypothetical protein